MGSVTDVETIISTNNSRKPLQTLQPAATDKNILVGADEIIRSIQQSKNTKMKKDMDAKKTRAFKNKKVTNKDMAVQTVGEEKLTIKVEDLTSTDKLSEDYWQTIAGRRQLAIVDTLKENKELLERIEKLEEENRLFKEMLDETKILVEVLQEEIEDKNQTSNLLDGSTI